MADVRCQTATVSELEDGQKLGTVVLSETAKPEAKLVELVRFDEKGFPIFKMDVLETILYRGGAKDLPTVAISICGAHNSGKSFLLHVLLMYFRYLEHFERSMGYTQTARLMRRGHWANSEHTDGIWVWNKVMKVTLKGTEVAVILLDCQGSGDSASQNVEMLTTYMSMRISNVQLYNVEPDWSISHLRMVEIVADALTGSTDFNLQSLIWLIRGHTKDDRFEEFPKALDERLKELKSADKPLAKFANKTCFLLPTPGRKVFEVGKPNAAAAESLVESEASSEEEYVWPRPAGPSIRYDTEVLDMSLEEIDARDPTWDPPEGYSYGGLSRMYFLDPEAIPRDKHTFYKGVNFKLPDVEKNFTTAVRKVLGIITGRLLNVKELKTGAHIVYAYRGMREMFKEPEEFQWTPDRMCEDVMVAEVFLEQEIRIHDDMMNWMSKIQTMTMVNGWDEWRERQLSTSKAAFESNRILAFFGDSEITKSHQQDFIDKLMNLDNEIYFFRLGVKYIGVAKELMAAGEGEREVYITKLGDVYREVQENINKLFVGKNFTAPPFLYHNREKLFKCGFGHENRENKDLPAVNQFLQLFTKRKEEKEVVELVYPPEQSEAEGGELAGAKAVADDKMKTQEEATPAKAVKECEAMEIITSDEGPDKK